jgi:predicted  nucleic acid-binding Zn-ribbon protein
MTTPAPDAPVARSEPLTIEDFRSLRRWLAVLGAAAAIASAIAVYALVTADGSAGDDEVAALEDRLAKAERELGAAGEESDVRDVQRRLRRTGEEADIRVLDERITRLENDIVTALDAGADRGRELNRLTQRVEALAREVRRLREDSDGG